MWEVEKSRISCRINPQKKVRVDCLRAENSRTIRHLSEFYMLEAEMGYVDSVHSIMDNAEQCVKVKHKITQSKPLGIPFLKVEKFYRIIYVS